MLLYNYGTTQADDQAWPLDRQASMTNGTSQVLLPAIGTLHIPLGVRALQACKGLSAVCNTAPQSALSSWSGR